MGGIKIARNCRFHWDSHDHSFMVLIVSILLAFSITAAEAFQTLQHQQAAIIITGLSTRRSKSALAAAPIIDPIMLPEAAKSIAAMIAPPDTTTTTTTTSSALSFLLMASSSSAGGLSSYDPVDPVGTGMLSQPTAIAVFVIGLVPWTIATYEFWRRIAVGESFGTKDPVVFTTTTTIGEDDNPARSRGRQVLGKGALLIAYAIFTVVAAVLGLVLYSVLSTPTATPMG